jgi:hypothetical protein
MVQSLPGPGELVGVVPCLPGPGVLVGVVPCLGGDTPSR